MGGTRSSQSLRSRLAKMDAIQNNTPWCHEHGKLTYPNRKQAKRKLKDRGAIQPRPGTVLNVYECHAWGDDDIRYHIGHSAPPREKR